VKPGQRADSDLAVDLVEGEAEPQHAATNCAATKASGSHRGDLAARRRGADRLVDDEGDAGAELPMKSVTPRGDRSSGASGRRWVEPAIGVPDEDVRVPAQSS
jgi:hypothetical protein